MFDKFSLAYNCDIFIISDMLAEIATRQVLQNATREVLRPNEPEQGSSGQSLRQKSTSETDINWSQVRIQKVNTTAGKSDFL